MVSPLSEDRDPFGPTADPAAYVPRHETERVLARLLRCVRDENRPAALCGPPGLGKTLVLRLLAARLAYRFQPVYLPYGALPISGLCAWALRQLDEWADDDGRQALCDAAQRRWAGGGGVLLLIDDANAMPIDTAREVGQLVASAGEALRVVVASLDDERAAQVIAALGENVETVRLDKPMSEAECGQYLRARLEHADVSQSLRERFDEATVARLYRISEGVPRSLHEAADSVLHPRLDDEAADAPEAEGAAAARLEALALEAAAAPSAAGEAPASEVAEQSHMPAAPTPAPEPEQIIPPRARRGFPVRPKRPFRRLVSQMRTTLLAVLLVVAAAMVWLLVEGLPVEVAPAPEEPAAQAPPSPEPRELEPVAREPMEPAPQAEPAPIEPAPQTAPVVAVPAPVEPVAEAEPVVVAPAPVVEPAPLEVAPEAAPAVAEEIAEEAPPAPVEPAPVAEVEPVAPVPVIETAVAENVAEVQPTAAAAEAAPEGTGVPEPQSFPVNINAKPWAVIEVDGVEVGVTPLANIPLAAGPRQIRARMPDGRVVERVVEVDAETRFVAFE